MKKGWKVFWIVCAVMAAAGIVMTAAGIALGGAAMLSSADESGPVHEWLQRTGRIVTENTAPGEPDGDMITAYEGIDEIIDGSVRPGSDSGTNRWGRCHYRYIAAQSRYQRGSCYHSGRRETGNGD